MRWAVGTALLENPIADKTAGTRFALSMISVRIAVIQGLLIFCLPMQLALADSSSPLLAAYYDRQMAIVNGAVYGWRGNDTATRLPINLGTDSPKQVAVGRQTYYLLTKSGRLIGFLDNPPRSNNIMSNVIWFSAGSSGVLAIKTSGDLWWITRAGTSSKRLADGVVSAAVGDGANYYVTRSHDLFVRGKAHRGQYGDGRLTATEEFVRTASDVAQITAHTGHAILLKTNGEVWGTGGNIYGPVGRHGLGDKADRWSKIASGVRAIATGSSHSLAIRHDGTLLAWGSEYGPDPRPIMKDVAAVAAGVRTSIAITGDGKLWQWDRGKTPRSIAGIPSR